MPIMLINTVLTSSLSLYYNFLTTELTLTLALPLRTLVRSKKQLHDLQYSRVHHPNPDHSPNYLLLCRLTSAHIISYPDPDPDPDANLSQLEIVEKKKSPPGHH